MMAAISGAYDRFDIRASRTSIPIEKSYLNFPE